MEGKAIARKLSPLPKTQFSGIDYTNIRDDIINLVTDNPDYNQRWDDFLSSDAGRMLIELFAYIGDNLATRIDWVSNENWISTATQKSSVMRILKILGYNFTLPYSSSVVINVTVPSSGYGDSWPGKFYLTPTYTQGLSFSPYYISAKDKKGVSRNYEALSYDATNNRYDYKVGVSVGDTFATSTGQIKFYEGKTYVETFTVTTDNAYSITLNKSPIIEGSARVYFADDTLMTETELLKVGSFLDAEAQRSTNPTTGLDEPIPFVLSVGENDTVTVSFGPTSLLPATDRRPSIGDKIRVFYRVGGGIDGNLVRDAINVVQLVTVSPIVNPTNLRNIHIGFENLTEGQGGQDAESPEHAIIYAPLTIRTVEKAVTAEDYDILLNANTNIITAKSFGAGNAPVDVYARYGTTIKPTEVWSYIAQKQAGWENLGSSKYNQFYWMSTYLDNRFNEQYAFRSGAFNYLNTVQSTALLGTTKLRGDTVLWRGDTWALFFNYTYLDTPADLKNSFVGDSKFKAIATSTIDTGQQFLNLQNKLVADTIFGGDTGLYSRHRIVQPIQSYYVSPIDFVEGVNLSVSKYIKLNIDNKGDTVIDLTYGAVSASKVSAFEIANAINVKLANIVGGLHPYGANYGDSTGINGGASVIEVGTANYLKIQGFRKGNKYFGDTVGARLYIKKVQVGFNDATSLVFGAGVSGDTYCCYPYRRLTLVKNTGISSFGKIIYENGSVGLYPDPSSFYVHYLKGDTQTLKLGTYFNYNFTQGVDAEWRSVANRIYNTVKKSTGDSIPDDILSDYQLRFTKVATSSPLLYAINNDWSLFNATPASITTPTLGDTVILRKGRYRIKVGIDGKGDTIIRIAGDSGGDSKYLVSRIGDTINNQLRILFKSWSGDSYGSCVYTIFDPVYKRITITSPFSTNGSQVRLSTLPGNGFNAVSDLFSLNESTNYTYKVRGDYYLNYNSTSDLMELVKTNNGYSQMPDATFFTHFLWDRRGSTVVDEYTYQTYLADKKLLGIDTIFKQPIFGTFDIAGIIYFNRAFSASEIKSAVETALTNEYNFTNGEIVNRDFGQSVARSKIEKTIHSIVGVEYVSISYFGRDMTDSTTNENNQIEADFDEILVVSDNVYTGSTQIHGMKFDYLVFSS